MAWRNRNNFRLNRLVIGPPSDPCSGLIVLGCQGNGQNYVGKSYRINKVYLT